MENLNNLSLFLLSDVNLDFIRLNLEKIKDIGLREIYSSEYGEYRQIFNSLKSNDNFNSSEYLFIWPSPEGVSNQFKNLKNHINYHHDKLLDDLSLYTERILSLSLSKKAIFLPLLNKFDEFSNLGLGNMSKDIGYNATLHKVNSLLIDSFIDVENIYLMDSFDWFRQAKLPFDNKLWLRGKIPFSIEFMNILSNAIKDYIHTLNIPHKK